MADRTDPRGLIAAGHPAVAATGVAVLRDGGNAFDAAVAAGFAAAVAEPCLTSLAGGAHLLARTTAGEEVLFDAFVDTPGRGLGADRPVPHFESMLVQFPAAVQEFHCGLGSVAVPGTLAGLVHVHRRLGRLPLDRVTAGAARLAEEGVALPPKQASILGLLEPIMRRDPDVAAYFAPGGRLLRVGDPVRNPALAAFLEDVGAGRVTGFAGGPVGAGLVAAMAAGGGLVTAEDLAAYRVVERDPLRVTFRGRTVLTNPAPSFGGRLVALALRLLEERGGDDGRPGEPSHATALIAVMQEVDRRRVAELAGPHPPVTRGTTHISVADAEGNVAALTGSNGECSGDLVPGTGVMLNNMLGEDDLHPDGFHAFEPGVRVASMMTPTVVVGADGAVEAVLGSGGSKRIRSAVLQVLLHLLDGGAAVADAVEAPRVHWDGEVVQVEPGFPAATEAALAAVGPVNRWPDLDVYFGGVHAVVPGAGAAGDPRRDGTAASA